MPYKVGAKGSYGCSGYPAVKDDGTVMGCHKTRAEAAAQIYAINRSEGNIGKDIWEGSAFAKKKKPDYGSFLSGRRGEPTNKELYARIIAEAKRKFDVYPSAVANSWVVQEYKRRGGKYKVSKSGHIQEGDFVMGNTKEGVVHGMVEHIMWEGGTLGTAGSEYALESMPPENPAMSVRIYEQEDQGWEPTAYSIGMMYQDAQRLESLEGHMMPNNEEKSSDSLWETVGRSNEEPGLGKAYEGCGCPTCKQLNVNCENCPVCQANGMKNTCCGDIAKEAPCWDGYVQRGMKPGEGGTMVPNCVPVEKADDLWEDADDVVYETDTVSKAEGYSPPAGARNAAKRAIRWKEEGKAKGAGTAVGWTRAGQLARGETLSLSTVKRMYSYFSRHEVDKKGKDFYNTSNPSNGRIMWEAWGGDAGYSWSRRIAQREADKMIFSNFGKDFSRTERLTEVFKRERSMETRRRLAQTGEAMPDGSYPIVTVEDLRNAIQAFGRTDNPAATKEHIKRRARALGRTDLLPENW